MYDPRADLARGTAVPPSLNQCNQNSASMHHDTSLDVHNEMNNYQQIKATQNNA